MKKGQKGFTLVELLIVIAIIGILAAIAIPRYNSATDSAKVAQVRATLSTIESAGEIYRAANNGTEAANIGALGTYLKRAPSAEYSYASGVATYTKTAPGGVTLTNSDAEILAEINS